MLKLMDGVLRTGMGLSRAVGETFISAWDEIVRCFTLLWAGGQEPPPDPSIGVLHATSMRIGSMYFSPEGIMMGKAVSYMGKPIGETWYQERSDTDRTAGPGLVWGQAGGFPVESSGKRKCSWCHNDLVLDHRGACGACGGSPSDD